MSEKTKIINLKPGMENVNVEVRVLENLGVRTINTKAGVRTLGEYIVGDESGRVKLVLWGAKAASLASGDTVSIRNAWVTSFKGEVQLNAGKNSSIDKVPDENLPPAESIPEDAPKSSEGYQPERRSFRRGEGRGRGGRRFR
ncbi:MAG: single-stranded DNA-binding protein [Ignisphaera sp.]|uniref:Single-stranded DNA-binding protein n=1 Tax=Ignisphaera aggregans TaxID=334771 RepID=A0A7J3MXA4_9CREN